MKGKYPFNKLIELHWRKGFVEQHSPKRIARWLDGVFPYSQVKHGDLSKKQGDVVIVNLGENEYVGLYEYLSHTLGDIHIETNGIYTNVFFSDKSLEELLRFMSTEIKWYERWWMQFLIFLKLSIEKIKCFIRNKHERGENKI